MRKNSSTRSAREALRADSEWRPALGFLTPLAAFVGALIVLPVLGTFWNSLFLDLTFLPRRFIGFENYTGLWQDPAFWRSLRFTVLFVLISVPLETLLGLFIALILNETFSLRGLLRACVLIPWAMGGESMRLTFDNCTKRFLTLRGVVQALQELTLSIEDGEFFVLLGPSGCGKSTLLNLAAGLEKPSSGEIRFAEKRVAAPQQRIFVPPRGRNVAMVFQSYALYPHMSVYENIAFPLRIGKEQKPKIDQEVRSVADLLGIANLLERKPGELSGGQRQRVAIARALVRRPDVFLLDEPLSNLDAQLRTSTRTELKRLQKELQITTLYVTHDQTEAMTLGDRIALLRQGQLVQVGTPDDLYERPRFQARMRDRGRQSG